MRKLHIGVLSEPDHFHTRKWVKALREAGAEVTVFSFFQDQIPEAPCVYIPPVATRGGKFTYLSYLLTGQRLRKALEAHQVDVLNPINVTPYGVWGRWSGFRPMAMVSMGADILEYPPRLHDALFPVNRAWSQPTHTDLRGLDRMVFAAKWHVFRSQVAAALRASAFITGDNLHLVDSVRAYFGIDSAKVHLHRWGVEPELFAATGSELTQLRTALGIPEGKRLIISPRGLKPIYQGDIILSAFEQLLQEGACPDHQFVALSAGYDIPARLDAQARELAGRYEQFTYVPQILPREQVLQLWNLCDVMISAPVYDGYSNALSEARYMGVVPVVNDIPASHELIVHQQNGWIVEGAFTPDRLARALREVMADLAGWKEKFEKVNREWIEKNALLSRNMAVFLERCEALVADTSNS